MLASPDYGTGAYGALLIRDARAVDLDGTLSEQTAGLGAAGGEAGIDQEVDHFHSRGAVGKFDCVLGYVLRLLAVPEDALKL